MESILGEGRQIWGLRLHQDGAAPYRTSGQKIIFSLDSYIMRGGVPTQWEKGSKSSYKYKISPSGDLINIQSPNYSLYRDDSLSEDQLKLLEIAPSLVKKYPYP